MAIIKFRENLNDVISFTNTSSFVIVPASSKKKYEEEVTWGGVLRIVKEKPIKGYDNPISPKDVFDVLDIFGMSSDDVSDIGKIILSAKAPDPKNKWSFGIYQVVWETKKQKTEDGKEESVLVPKDNFIVIWAQKLDKIEFEWEGLVQQGEYYKIRPIIDGETKDTYISRHGLRNEILGNTLFHEIGHHVDIWHYGRDVEKKGAIDQAEAFASAYALARTEKAIDSDEYKQIVNEEYDGGLVMDVKDEAGVNSDNVEGEVKNED